MKTKTFLLLCLLAVLGIGTAKAQNGVSKYVTLNVIDGDYLECTGDYLYGSVFVQTWLSPHNLLFKVRGATVYGYKDPAGTIPSGNVYEFSNTSPGWNNFVETGHFRVNGKLIVQFHFQFHQTINANGETTVEFFTFKFNCD